MNDILASPEFFSQLCSQLASLYHFYRNKALFLFELLKGLGFIYIFIFFFSDFIINASMVKLNFIELVEAKFRHL